MATAICGSSGRTVPPWSGRKLPPRIDRTNHLRPSDKHRSTDVSPKAPPPTPFGLVICRRQQRRASWVAWEDDPYHQRCHAQRTGQPEEASVRTCMILTAGCWRRMDGHLHPGHCQGITMLPSSESQMALAIDLCMSLCTDRLPLHVHAQIALAFGRCMKIAAELLFTSRAVQRLE